MKNAKLYLLTKQIHRILVPIVIVTGLFMMTTGFFMSRDIYASLDPALVRYLHNKLSTVFGIILGGMMFTGLYLFLFPYLPSAPTESTKR